MARNAKETAEQLGWHRTGSVDEARQMARDNRPDCGLVTCGFCTSDIDLDDTPATLRDPGMTCGGCVYWNAPAQGALGQCRRQPPQMSHESAMGVWPETTAHDWCGHFLYISVDLPRANLDRALGRTID